MSMSLDLRTLAYAFSDKRTLVSMAASVKSEYLCPELRVFWELVLRCFDKYKDIPTAKVLAHVAGDAWSQMEATYQRVAAAVPQIDARERLVDLEKLKERFNDHLLRKAGQQVFQRNWNGNGFDDLPEANRILRDTVARIDRLHRVESYKEGTLAGTAQEAWAKYQRVKNDPASASGIHLGFAELDRITNGIRESELLLIGGESGTGKSALAMNMAVNAWLGSNRVQTDPEAGLGPFALWRAIVYFTI